MGQERREIREKGGMKVKQWRDGWISKAKKEVWDCHENACKHYQAEKDMEQYLFCWWIRQEVRTGNTMLTVR